MAKRIQLIVTGDMERKAMVDALRGIFPDRVGRVLVEWQKATKVDGTTSSRLLRPEDGINSSMSASHGRWSRSYWTVEIAAGQQTSW